MTNSARRLRIAGMDCGSCALTIEDGLRSLPGMRRVEVDFTTESMIVEGDATDDAIARRLAQLGYGIANEGAVQAPAHAAATRGFAGFLRFLWDERHLRLAGGAAVVAIAATLASAAAPRLVPLFALSALYALIVIAAGLPLFVKGVRALLFGRRVTIDLLMAIAALGALAIDAGGEAVTVVLLYTLGEALEAYSAGRARDALRSLLALQPTTATIIQSHSHEHHGHDHHDHDHHDHAHAATRTVPVARVAAGDRVLVRPGERIPVDGVVRDGESAVDEAAVTGESTPVARAPGDPVLAGTVNGLAALEIEATRIAGDSTIARIARLVETAQASRSPAERTIDRFARWYTPAVVALAALLVAVPVLAFGQPLFDVNGERGWLYRGLALLIVACPCALVISIPVTVVSALTRLARLGVLVKGGDRLDALAHLDVLAFDKTGTLTHGRPAVTALQARDCDHASERFEACGACDEVLALAAAVEVAAGHPLSHAVCAAAESRGVAGRYPRAVGVRAVAGSGVTGNVRGAQVAIGSGGWFEAEVCREAVPPALADALSEPGRTVMLVARNGRLVGAIGAHDPLRDGAAAALQALRDGAPSLRTVMLTGDHERVAHSIARTARNIDEVRAGLLPAQKMAAIEQLQRDYGVVGMVGDGINDAPALARADVGVAMGAHGTAQAAETADVVLMRDDLMLLPRTLSIARQTRRLVRENIALSLGLKLAFLALTVPGWATLWLAVAADVGATLLVTVNGMRMLRA